MQGRQMRKKLTALSVAAAMALALAGCGGSAGQPDGTAQGEGYLAPEGTIAAIDKEVSMGRYVETQIDLTEQLKAQNAGMEMQSMCRLEDGRVVVLDSIAGVLVSGDEGDTWSVENPAWFTQMQQGQNFISTMAMTPDGTAAVVYDPSENGDEYQPVMKLILPDGTEVPVEPDLTEEEKYVRQVTASEEGRIFANTFDGVYEITTDGGSEKIAGLGPSAAGSMWIWARGSLLYLDTGTGAPLIYDLDADAYVEDEVLAEFMETNYADRSYNGSASASVYLLPGADDTLYIAGSRGIHRHVVGGNMMEQIVDGDLSILSNPAYNFVSMLELDGDTFLAIFDNGKAVRFRYDPNVPSLPENTLVIYSLQENADVRQAIAAFQTTHPDTFVSYKVGMSDDDSVTAEDAAKRLNTEIMAGTGPDLIVLDGLPVDSYVEKGLLLDLTDYLAQYSRKEPLFDNVIEALKTDGRAYMACGTVILPMLVAKEAQTANLTDLSGVADTVEKMRATNPGEDIVGICDERDLLEQFISTGASAWMRTDGTIDRDGIGQYLEQCKRIWDAQMDGISTDIVKAYGEDGPYYTGFGAEEIRSGMVEHGIQQGVTAYAMGEMKLLSGWTISYYTYAQLLSIRRNFLKDCDDVTAVPMQGQCTGVFAPRTLIGVSAASGKQAEAQAFLDVFLSADAQSMYSGFPLNQNAFDMQFTPEASYLGPNDEYVYLSTQWKDGKQFDFTIYWPEDAQIADFKAQIGALTTPYIPDGMLEQAVLGEGVGYLKGECTLEETLDAVEKDAEIYMAE